MRWIYILKCSDDYNYVGETKRLYRRFWEHNKGNGGVNTSNYKPEQIVAIYKVSILSKFFEYNSIIMNKSCNIYFNRSNTLLEEFNDDCDDEEYDNLLVENNITECLMINKQEKWEKIRGGKYTNFDVKYKYPKNENIKNLPLCKCDLPCDIKKNEEKNYLFFRCAKKNMWNKMKDEFEIEEEPCNYFMKYTKDIEYKKYYEERKTLLFNLVKKSPWLKELIGIMSENCIGGCGKKYDENNTIRYSKKAINLCFDCFINKNEELRDKYNIITELDF